MGSFKDTVFDEEASQLITRAIPPYVGSFKPEVSLTPLYGTSTLGSWQLKVLDNVQDVQFGYIQSWSIEFKYALSNCDAEVRYNSLTYTETCTGSGSGVGNGYIDPGETANLTIKLQNKGNQNATNVRAVLSSPTTGVIVSGNTAFYPDIPSGSSKQNNSPYVIYFSNSISCGTIVNFNLNIYTDQGNWNDSFQLNIGRINYTTLMSQNWDGSRPPNLPTGWTKVDVAGTTGDWISVANSTDPPPVSPSIIMQYSANGNDNDSTRLY